MALPVKYELKCMLVDLDTQKKIGEFKARIVRGRQYRQRRTVFFRCYA